LRSDPRGIGREAITDSMCEGLPCRSG